MTPQEIKIIALQSAVTWANAWRNRAPMSDTVIEVAEKFEKYLNEH